MFRASIVFVFAVLSCSLALEVLGPVTDLSITNQQLTPDGTTRSAVAACSAFPGALISGAPTGPDSQFRVRVWNELEDTTMATATSIHWHGLYQKNSSWADGVAGVTQCPITPGNSFEYAFNASGQSGTYWYHSDYMTQSCDGLRGPLVIYDPNDPYKSLYSVDDESTIITLADWYDQPTKQSIPCVPPSATLINGLGRPWCNTVSPGYGVEGCGSDGPSTTLSPLSVVSVTKGTTYRFRIISLSCQPAFKFSIDNHNLTIIEADGQLHQKYTVDSVTVYPGQRYSAVVTANQNVGNYWIRAQPIIDGLTGYPTTFTNGINSAILRYSGASAVEPTSTITPGTNELVESKLVPYANPAAPGGADVNAADVYKLNLDFSLVKYSIFLNGMNRTLPTSTSVLSQVVSGNTAALANPMYFSLPANSVIQLSFPAGDTAPDTHHPIHLHGTAFSVVRSAGQSTYNFKNPPRRDVVNTGVKGDNVTIRFTTGNSGTWALYCQEPFHSTAGMEAIFVVDTPAHIKSYTPVSSEWNNLCSSWDTFNSQGKW